MDKELLQDQLEYISERIDSTEKAIKDYEPDKKGFKDLVEVLQKWTDLYNETLDKLQHADDMNLEVETFALEIEKFIFEKDKFDYEKNCQKHKELVEMIFRGVETGIKIAIPCTFILGSFAMAKFSYMSDADLKLCNGRINTSARELLKTAFMSLKV